MSGQAEIQWSAHDGAYDLSLYAPDGVNALAGTFRLPEGVKATSVSEEGAIKVLWLTEPSPDCSKPACEVRFEGMIPGGMQGSARLFSVAVDGPAGTPTLTDTEAYANDGIATPVELTLAPAPVAPVTAPPPAAPARGGVVLEAALVISLVIVCLLLWRRTARGGKPRSRR